MTGVLLGVFWTSAGVLLATYLRYPAIVFALSRLARRVPSVDERAHRRVTLIIAARDEEDVIGPKLRSCLDQDYPADQLDILVVSDGSTDGTVDACRGLRSPRVRVLALPAAMGKASALNEAMSTIDSEFIVMSDARQPLEPRAVSRLMRWFSDPRIGAVSGDLRFASRPDRGVERATAFYRGYERGIRVSEARLDSCVGATGALYAFRAGLWKPLPSGLILDDVCTPMQIALQGYRIWYETEAKATDQFPDSPASEFKRRMRTLAGNYQLLTEMPELLVPWRNRLWIQFMFHKVGRLVSPLALFLIFVTSAVIPGVFFKALFGVQALVWILGLGIDARWLPPALRKPHGVLRTFALYQVAAGVAFWKFVRDDYDVWRPGTALVQSEVPDPEWDDAESPTAGPEVPASLEDTDFRATKERHPESERRRAQW